MPQKISSRTNIKIMSNSNNIFKNERDRNDELNIANRDAPNGNSQSNVDWCAEAHKLRQRNRELIKKVVKLEQNIADSQEKFQSQLLRTRTGDTLLSQQQEELTASQEQIEYLTRDIQKLDRTVQRQNILIETLSKQLETSQEQIAQLERECALIQEENERKTQKLSQAETQVEELSDRLYRQQRYTLEFKAALDEVLEVPSPSNSLQQQLNGTAIVPKVNAIQPWSAEKSESITEETAIDSEPEPEPAVNTIKPVLLPNLDSNRVKQNYSAPPPLSPKVNKVDRPVNKSKRKKRPQSEIDLPKLPRYRSL